MVFPLSLIPGATLRIFRLASRHRGNTQRAEIIRWFRQKSSENEIRQGLPALYPRLWRFCLFLTGVPDRAEDLAQATCARALEKHEGFQPGTQLDRWLFVLARRVWLNEVRRDAVRAAGMTAVDLDALADISPGADANIFFGEVLKEVAALPEAQRMTVVLVYVEGYTYQEAADMLDIPIGTVMSRLAAARRKVSGRVGVEWKAGE